MKRRPTDLRIRSTLFSRFPGIVYGLAQGPRIPVDMHLGRRQPAFLFAESIAQHAGIRRPHVVLNHLVHGRTVHSDEHLPELPLRGDGLVSTRPSAVLFATVADCVPVFAFDPKHRVIGLAHAGRQGTARGVVTALITALRARGASLSTIYVWLGPSAQSCCYSFDEHRDARYYIPFVKACGRQFVTTKNGRVFVDMHGALVKQLRAAGIRSSHIEQDSTCTIHSTALPSHARQRDRRTRALWAYIGLKDPADTIAQKRVLVMGLGVHGGGIDTVRWLARHGARLTITDIQSRAALTQSLAKLRGIRARYVLGQHRVKDFTSTDLIVASPGVPRDSKFLSIAREHGIPIESDASLFFARARAPIVGITGTKGKTSTTLLVMDMLTRSHRRVIGAGYHQTPMMTALDRAQPRDTIVAELSSWRLERLENRSHSPHIAVITNIMPDHLNRYRDFKDYTAAKELIVANQSQNDHAILNRDNAVTRRIGSRVRSVRWWFSLRPFPAENGAFIRRGVIVLRAYGTETTIAPVPVSLRRQPHQLTNVLAALIAARLSGASISAIRASIAHPPVVPHRLEFVRSLNGITYINDSAATTPDAARAALHVTGSRTVLIAGGTDKSLSYTTFARELRRCRFTVLLAGTATDKILAALPATSRPPVVQSMPEAVRRARAAARPGDTVLCSPGAASFGLFIHEFDRGDQFTRAVNRLTA